MTATMKTMTTGVSDRAARDLRRRLRCCDAVPARAVAAVLVRSVPRYSSPYLRVRHLALFREIRFAAVAHRVHLDIRPWLRRWEDRCGASSEKKTGTKVSVPKVASSSPPMTARPSGAFCSPPSPRPSAIGTMPMIIASAVMMTGRKRVKPAESAASDRAEPSLHLLLGEADHQDRVRRGHAHAHDGAGERGNADVGPGDEQHPDDARQRAGQRRDDDEGIEPALEVHHDQSVDQDDGEQQAEDQPHEGAVHGLNLAAHE